LKSSSQPVDKKSSEKEKSQNTVHTPLLFQSCIPYHIVNPFMPNKKNCPSILTICDDSLSNRVERRKGLFKMKLTFNPAASSFTPKGVTAAAPAAAPAKEEDQAPASQPEEPKER
jgi:hypothetical protein